MRRLLLTGVGLVLVLYFAAGILPIGNGQDGAARHPQKASQRQQQSGLTITVLVNGKAQEMPLETYVEGVTAAEIADDFPVEAIRAQAVAARTYAVSERSRGRPAEHPDADVCDDYSHCAAYQPDAVKTFSTGYSRIRKAVKDTAGQTPDLRRCTDCGCVPLRRRSEDRVCRRCLGRGYSVSAKRGQSGRSDAVRRIPERGDANGGCAPREKVAQTLPKADVAAGTPDRWFASSVRSAAGGVKTVKLGGVTVEGTAVRALFGLQSTNFTITTAEDSITFHTIGYGHGVGLSQYGAKYMAEQGKRLYRDTCSLLSGNRDCDLESGE